MIRFEPDTLRDALWRPLAMAAPDSDVYLEIMAPDLRFAVLLLLTVVSVVTLRRSPRSRPVVLLLAFVWLAFVPWLMSSGNGRYFLPVLLAVGPLCIALIHRLPMRGRMRASLALLVVAAQATAVGLADPRASWGLVPWGQESYVDLDLSRRDREVPATYVTVSTISYSLFAPLFAPGSRWIGLAAAGSPDMERRVGQALADSRAAGLPLRLLVPTVPRMTPQAQPDATIRAEIARLLGPHRLALDGTPCRILHSHTMALRTFPGPAPVPPGMEERMGFWECGLNFPVAPAPQAPASKAPPEVEAVFGRLEQSCPRLFPPGGAKSVRIDGAYMRVYGNSDMKAFVLDNSEVYFRYWRALNGNLVGHVSEILEPGFKVDCSRVNGRSGLPWEREI